MMSQTPLQHTEARPGNTASPQTVFHDCMEAEPFDMVQGTFGWRSVTSLFTKEEEQGADQTVEQRPEMTTEQIPTSRTSDNPPQKSSAGLWGVFTSRWQQSNVQRSEARGVLADPPEEHNEAQNVEETPFRWSFLTGKLAELRSKNE